MHCLKNGLCICLVGLLITGCANDKKLPQGERLSIIDSETPYFLEYNNESISLPKPVRNRDWAQNGINANHITGNLAAETNLLKLWDSNFGNGINQRDLTIAPPVIYNGTIFVMDAKGLVSAFSLSSGEKLWENLLTANIGGFKDTKSRASGLAVDNTTLYATTGFGGVFAIETTTGKPKWRKILSAPIRIAPTLTDNALIVQTIDNKLYSLDKNNGEENWRFGVASEDTVISGSASPAFDEKENVIVAGFSNGEIVVLNATIGTPLWSEMLDSNDKVNSTTEINTIGSYPIIDNGTIYAISNSNMLMALDMRTGDKVWKKEIGSLQNMLMVGDYLFVISNKNILYAIDKNEGNIAWNIDIKPHLYDNEVLKAEIYASQPIMINSDILLSFSNGKVFKISAAKGIIKSKIDLNLGLSNGLVVAEDKIISVTDDADIIVYQ